MSPTPSTGPSSARPPCLALYVLLQRLSPSPLANRESQYTSKAAFLEATIAHLGSHVLTEPLKIRPTNVVTAATEGQAGKTTAVVEMQSIDAQCRDGMTYDMRVRSRLPPAFWLVSQGWAKMKAANPPSKPQ